MRTVPNETTPSGRPCRDKAGRLRSVRARAARYGVPTLVPALLLVALAPATPGVAGSAPNTWTPTGSMNNARAYDTATLLQNGRVLVAAGGTTQCCVYENTAELYNAATGAWSPTGSLNIARNQHTATLLPNGKVLVAGGFAAYNHCADCTLTSAELYDPVNGTWTATGSMAVDRAGHTATLLPDGTVLVAGGFSSSGTTSITNSAELYHPATGTWTTTGSMIMARWNQTATLLPNGQVLVAGGLGLVPYFNATLNSAELYNPATGTWTATGSMAVARNSHTATLLPNGQVLVAGGCSDPSCGTSLAGAELYNPATGAWSTTGSMLTARGQHTATLLRNGQVLVAGGCCTSSQLGFALAELYNPATGIWSPTGFMSIARFSHTATLLPNGQVLVAGGCANSVACGVSATAELYTPGSSPLAVIAPTSLSFVDQPVGAPSPPQTVTVTNTGTLPLTVSGVTVGGTDPGDFADTTSCLTKPIAPGYNCSIAVTFTPAAKGARSATLTVADNAPSGPQNVALSGNGSGPSAWSHTGSMPFATLQPTATRLRNGTVLVAGGSGAGAELYDPASSTWSPTGAMTTARYGHTATLLPNGTVLVAGGCCAGPSALASAEIYNPVTGTWTATGSMHSARQYHTATLLPNGRVLVAGGCNYACGPGSTGAELYDPATGTWSVTGSMRVARASHTATLLPSGKVLVAGGCCPVVAGTELYDPATGTWSPSGNLKVARSDHTATLLPSGQVLVAGGFTQYCTIEGCGTATLANAELYDPRSGVWTLTGRMGTARGQHTATLLPNGQVLVAGGCADDPGCLSLLSSAEVYSPVTGLWMPTSPMILPRGHHTATLLPSGKVLVAGGTAAPIAEVYTPPLLKANPATARVGQTIAVSGAAFPVPDFPGQEQVALYWDSITTSPLATATLTTSGSFSAKLTVPTTGAGTHMLIGVSTVSGAATGTIITVTP